MENCDLKVYRKKRTPKTTIGEMHINGKFFCHTLEDFDRDFNHDGDLRDSGELKVYGKTAIPAGVKPYEVVLSMSAHLKKILPEIKNVDGFDGVRIHGGNTDADSLGCILVGHNMEEDRISKSASDDLVAELKKYKNISLTIVN